MSESVVFELKLQIQHLEEKLTFLAGGTNGAELVEVLMEKDEELEKKSLRLKHMEGKMMQLAEGAKRLDGKRRELARHSEHQGIRMEGLEKELDRQLGISDELRSQVLDTKQDLAAVQEQLRKTQADMAATAESAKEDLNAVRAEASSLQDIVERQRVTISELQEAQKGLEETLEETVTTKNEEIKSLEQRKKDIAHRSREMKNNLESLLWDSHKSRSELTGQRGTLEQELKRLRRRMEDRSKMSLEEERKATDLARECGALKTQLEAAGQDIAFANEELKAVRASKSEADETLIAKGIENAKLRTKNESLKKEMDRRLHLANQEKIALSESMANTKRLFDERETTLGDQIKHMEEDSSALADALAEKVAQLEEQLTKAEEGGERLRTEARALKEDMSAKARRFEAGRKTEARWRARAEGTISSQEVKLEQLKTELVAARQQGADLRHMEVENKDLKDRIERQEVFQRRRMEKEKKERRSKSGLRASLSDPSDKAGGRDSVQLVPLPPPMNERKNTGGEDVQECSQGNDGNNDSAGTGRDTPQPAPISSAADVNSMGSGVRSAKVPTVAPRGRVDKEGGARGGGGGERRGVRSVSPFARPFTVSSSSRGSAKFFSTPEYSTPEYSRNAEKENNVKGRRSTASGAETSCSSSGSNSSGSGRNEKRGHAGGCTGVSDVDGGRGDNRKANGAGDTHAKDASAGKRNSQRAGSRGGDRAREKTSSGTGRSRPLESRKNMNVSKSPAVEPSDSTQPSRGRRAVATKSAAVAAPRSSSLGKQTRAATGWR